MGDAAIQWMAQLCSLPPFSCDITQQSIFHSDGGGGGAGRLLFHQAIPYAIMPCILSESREGKNVAQKWQGRVGGGGSGGGGS